MQQEAKLQIIAAANEYIKEKGLSQNDVARLTGINAGYLSHMLRSQLSTTVQNKSVDIADKWFYMLSEWAGLSIKKQHWEPLQTKQFIEMIACLDGAQKQHQVITLICDSGLGKTFIVDRFRNMHPRNCIKITVNSTYKLKDLLGAICEKLAIPSAWSSSQMLRTIIEKLQDLKRQGEKIIIIIDEAENMQLPTLKMLKGLYDGVKGFTSIALIGTPQLITTMDKLKKKDAVGIPQLYRRIKAGIRYINNHHDNFRVFFDKYVEDKGLRKLLLTLCDNYGELHDYLQPVLKEAYETEQPLTEQLFRLHHNLPNY